jgi:hypothetical protein
VTWSKRFSERDFGLCLELSKWRRVPAFHQIGTQIFARVLLIATRRANTVPRYSTSDSLVQKAGLRSILVLLKSMATRDPNAINSSTLKRIPWREVPTQPQPNLRNFDAWKPNCPASRQLVSLAVPAQSSKLNG